MFKYLAEHGEDLVAVKLTGTSDTGDYAALIPEMEEKISRYGKINLYWEMEDFSGWTPESFWRDLKFDVQHLNDFKKIAVVGDTAWEKGLTLLMKPFTSAEVRFYPVAEKEAALAWVQQA